jgi:hypothetical protein
MNRPPLDPIFSSLVRATITAVCCAGLAVASFAQLEGLTPPQSDPDWPPATPPQFAIGMSSEEVEAVIRRLVPVLDSADAPDIEKVEAIRDWLHEFLPIADHVCDLWNLGVDHNNDPLATLFYMSEARYGGYYCGGQAEIARKVYELIGYETFTINFGFPNTRATHVTTFVKLETPEGPKWTIQDVYFNFTLRDADGDYLGLLELSELIARNELDKVVVDEKAGARTTVLHTDYGRMPRLNRRYNLEAECVRPWEDFEEFSIRWDFDLFETTYFDLSQELTARLGDNNPLYLFMLPIGYKGPDFVAQIEQDLIRSRSQLLQLLDIEEEMLTIPMEHPPKEYPPI